MTSSDSNPPAAPRPVTLLSTRDHSRDSAGLTYVYPVVSRRAGGVSVGVNLNPNNACNWRCVYCQVPGLSRGAAPDIDLALLEAELAEFLRNVVHGDFMATSVPAEARRLNDIALSGNGEPTSAAAFPEVVDLIVRQMRAFDLLGRIKLVLITNGSQVLRPAVRAALSRMREAGGEVWFKLDRATEAGARAVNDVHVPTAQALARLLAAAESCPTWVQTCMFAMDGAPPATAEIDAWLELLRSARAAGAALQGVLLYGLARPSAQPEAPRLTALPEAWMRTLAARVEALGLPVRLSL